MTFFQSSVLYICILSVSVLFPSLFFFFFCYSLKGLNLPFFTTIISKILKWNNYILTLLIGRCIEPGKLSLAAVHWSSAAEPDTKNPNHSCVFHQSGRAMLVRIWQPFYLWQAKVFACWTRVMQSNLEINIFASALVQNCLWEACWQATRCAWVKDAKFFLLMRI